MESKGELDFFVAKYSPPGQCLWVRAGGGSKIDRGYGVAVDAQGNVFATGHCQSTDAMFDGVAFENRGGDYDLFVAKYDATGKLQWLKAGGGAAGTASGWTETVYGPTTLTSKGSNDIMLLKLGR